MPEETGQSPATTSDPEPETGQTAAEASTETADEFDRERAMATIQKLRAFEREAKTRLREHEQLKQQLKQREEAELSERERLERRLAELEAAQAEWERERQETRLQAAVVAGAARTQARYPDAIVRLIDPAAVEWDERGQPANVDALVAEVRQRYPELFRLDAGSADGGAGSRARASLSMNDLIRQRAGRA